MVRLCPVTMSSNDLYSHANGSHIIKRLTCRSFQLRLGVIVMVCVTVINVLGPIGQGKFRVNIRVNISLGNKRSHDKHDTLLGDNR